MEETITCQVCGEVNPADMVICRNCQWPLRPAGGPASLVDSSATTDDAKTDSSSTQPVLPDWLRDAAAEFNKALEKPKIGRPRASEGLLSSPAAQPTESGEDVPDWVLRIGGTAGGETAPAAEAGGIPAGGGVVEDASPREAAGPSLPARTDLTAGELSDAGSEMARPEGIGSVHGQTLEQGIGDQPQEDIYEWLRRLDATAGQSHQPKVEDLSGPTNVPEWAKAVGSPGSNGAGQAGEALPGSEAELKDLSPNAPPPDSQEATPKRPEAESTSSSVPPDSTPTAGAAHTQIEPELPGSEPALRSVPEGAPSLDVDAVLASMQTPDWLEQDNVAEALSGMPIPPAAAEQEEIAPAELPSWVEALRPIESAVQEAMGGTPAELPVERGPLLGLKGVLPAIPRAAKAPKPTGAHAIRLEATEQQRRRAAQLEGIIARETQPIPLRAVPALSPQRTLRWAISAILLLVIAWSLLSGSQVFPLPGGVPNETLSAIRAVEAIPSDARVLVIFDYEPATVGEMEATGASLMDHLLLLRHPVLAVLSTSPTGSMLADRFISNAIADRGYESGTGYINLGYLPGGLAGVRAFAEDPAGTMPLDASAQAVWASPALSGIHRLSDFAAIVVLTDALESGRVWIEQTGAERGKAPMIVVSSAQAGPLLLPYAASGQIAGLVAGLNGAAGTEMANSGLPGFVRRYWDAYSLGLYVAALLIILGSARWLADAIRGPATDLGE